MANLILTRPVSIAANTVMELELLGFLVPPQGLGGTPSSDFTTIRLGFYIDPTGPASHAYQDPAWTDTEAEVRFANDGSDNAWINLNNNTDDTATISRPARSINVGAGLFALFFLGPAWLRLAVADTEAVIEWWDTPPNATDEPAESFSLPMTVPFATPLYAGVDGNTDDVGPNAMTGGIWFGEWKVGGPPAVIPPYPFASLAGQAQVGTGAMGTISVH